MNKICRKLQDTLAVDGPRALGEDQGAQDHLAECPSCFAFLESIAELDQGFDNLAALDAPEELVEKLLARPELAATGDAGKNSDAAPDAVTPWSWISGAAARLIRRRPLAWGAAMTAVLAFVLLLAGQRQAMSPLLSLSSDGRTDESKARPKPVKDFIPPPPPAPEDLSARRVARPNPIGVVGGQVVDKAGQPMPGVTVTAVSAKSTMAPTGTVTDANGRFRLAELAPSDDYMLSAELPGYAKVEVSPIDLDPGKTTTQNITLVPSTDQLEKVTIVAKGDIVDVASTKTATVFNSEFIEGLPIIGRSYQDILTLAPGTTDVDGDEDSNVTTDPTSGTFGSNLNLESIAEIEVITTGASAEFGQAQGGFANITTESGVVIYPKRIKESYVAPIYPEDAQGEARVVLEFVVRRDGSVGEVKVLKCDRPDLGFEEAAMEAARQWRYEPATALDGKPVDVHFTGIVEFNPASTEQGRMAPATDPGIRLARAFLDDRSSLDGIVFKPASGYWSNTYIPGDPALRLLHSRVRGRDRSALLPYTKTSLRLHDASRPAGQPFDAPESSALAVYLHADRRGIAEEGRLLVQVGLKGTPRQGGRRHATNLGLVLDLRGEIPQDTTVGMHALVDAFQQAKEPGDSFRLVIAGKAGAAVVEPDDFRHGYLRVILERVLAGDTTSTGPALEITEAVATAIQGVAATDDPNSPLGSSAVILITSQTFDAATTALADLAHRSAITGIPLSVVGVGSAIDLSELDRLTLAGQGHRRLLDSPAGASSLVDRELSAISDVIARAVRLRIRLAPGVRLIDVLGSEPLNEARTQRVRDAEKSIDLRIASNLGIHADRGEDEDGIQIVIPAFHADDTHVILLDVVAPGPGPVADVTVRYKDLVHLRNGVGRDALNLAGDVGAAGMLEHNVLKNLLSLRLSQVLGDAGRALAAADAGGAAEVLDEFRTLVDGLSRELPGLAGDGDLANDIAMLDEYRGLLHADIVAQPEHREHLSDSLLYAAWLKVLTHPMEMRS